MKAYSPRQHVELFHLLFLSQLGRKLDKQLYALKDGCNMRFYFNSIRYSEDMDFDIQIINKDTLTRNINQILNSIPFRSILRANHLEIQTFSSPKLTETTQRWKILLNSSSSTLALNTKIEFSRRSLDNDIQFETINPQILKTYSLPPIMSNHYSFQIMYEQKIIALALRNETQARDIFDLYFLICAGKMLNRTSKDTLTYLNKAMTNAMSVSFTDFKGQVIAYLPDEHQRQYNDPKAWNSIVENVVQSLEDQQNEIN